MLVASEIKAFLPFEGVKFEWDMKSIIDSSHVLAVSTHFKGVQKVGTPSIFPLLTPR